MNNASWPKQPIITHAGISVVFTWQVEKALQLGRKLNLPVGGPGLKLLTGYTPDCPDMVRIHNPNATFTTRGCVKSCSFCAVPKLEGEFRELSAWTPAPVVCDNNFLASSWSHFRRVIDSLRQFSFVDFNQGLDCTLLKPAHLDELTSLRNVVIRFAFDHTGMEQRVIDAITASRKAGFKDIRAYVLIGFDDTPEDALYRLELLRSLKVWPNPQRYQPLDATKKNSYVHPAWTDYELKRMMKYWANLRITNRIPYVEFDPTLCGKGHNKIATEGKGG